MATLTFGGDATEEAATSEEEYVTISLALRDPEKLNEAVKMLSQVFWFASHTRT